MPWYLYNHPFVQNAERHTHFTRVQGNEYARYCIRYRIPLIVNESTPEIINKIDSHSLQGFSKYIKIKILDFYSEDCTIQTAIFVTEIYNSIYVCYLSSVSYTHTMYKFAFDKIWHKTDHMFVLLNFQYICNVILKQVHYWFIYFLWNWFMGKGVIFFSFVFIYTYIT